MSDLVKRLRTYPYPAMNHLGFEAANELECLHSELTALKEILNAMQDEIDALKSVDVAGAGDGIAVLRICMPVKLMLGSVNWC